MLADEGSDQFLHGHLEQEVELLSLGQQLDRLDEVFQVLLVLQDPVKVQQHLPLVLQLADRLVDELDR